MEIDEILEQYLYDDDPAVKSCDNCRSKYNSGVREPCVKCIRNKSMVKERYEKSDNWKRRKQDVK